MSNKCPKCEMLVSEVTAESVEIRSPRASVSFRGVSYACPFCHSILSVQLDPLALKAEIVADLKETLRKD